MSAKDKKSLQLYLKSQNVNFLPEVILQYFFEQRAFKHISAIVLMQMCASRLCFALFAWFARAELLAGIVKAATGKACNECKAFGQLGLVCFKMLGHKCSFPNSHFLDSGRKK